MRRVAAIPIATLAVILILAGSAFFSSQSPAVAPVGALQNFKVGLDVKAYHAGSSVPFAERNLPEDLVLDNFNQLNLAIFNPYVSGSGTTVVLKENGSTTPIFPVWGSAVATQGCSWTGDWCNSGGNTNLNMGGYIDIGTSGTAPTRADNKMGTKYGPSVTVGTATCNAGATDTVTYSASVPIHSTVTIQEAGTFVQGWVNSGNGWKYIMLFHDTFTGIATSNGDTVTVQYTISFNDVGYNQNLCNLWAALITQSNTLNKNGVSVTLTTTAGGTNTFMVYPRVSLHCGNSGMLTTTTNSTCTIASAAAANAMSLAIGTGNTAFTPTSTQLNAQVGTAVITTNAYSSPNEYFTTTITIGSSNTIKEAGLFASLNGNSYMFLATVFTGQSQTANQPFGITVYIPD